MSNLPITHETLALILILGFFLLAGLCLSGRAFTQLLAYLAKRGLPGEVQRPDSPQAPTTSSTEKGNE